MGALFDGSTPRTGFGHATLLGAIAVPALAVASRVLFGAATAERGAQDVVTASPRPPVSR